MLFSTSCDITDFVCFQADALATIRTRKFLTNRLLNRKQMVMSHSVVAIVSYFSVVLAVNIVNAGISSVLSLALC